MPNSTNASAVIFSRPAILDRPKRLKQEKIIPIWKAQGSTTKALSRLLVLKINAAVLVGDLKQARTYATSCMDGCVTFSNDVVYKQETWLYETWYMKNTPEEALALEQLSDPDFVESVMWSSISISPGPNKATLIVGPLFLCMNLLAVQANHGGKDLVYDPRSDWIAKMRAKLNQATEKQMTIPSNIGSISFQNPGAFQGFDLGNSATRYTIESGEIDSWLGLQETQETTDA